VEQANPSFEIARDTLVGQVDPPKTYEERKLAGVCTRCGERPAGEENQLCDVCRENQRERVRRSMAKKRADRRRKKLCPHCPAAKATKVSKAGEVCLACRIKRDRVRSAGVTKDVNHVMDRTWTDGTGRQRFHGQAQRGRQPVWQLDDQDLAYALAAIQRARQGLAVARAPESEALPRAQRQDAIRAALSQAYLGQRHIEEILERNRYHSNQILTRRKVRR